MFEAEFWVAIAFLLFIGVLGYFGAHKRLVNSIDDRRERIKAELAEARRLKSEAEALLASYRRKQQEAEREAQTIVASRRIRPATHQNGGNQDCPGRSPGRGRCALGRQRSRSSRGGSDPHP